MNCSVRQSLVSFLNESMLLKTLVELMLNESERVRKLFCSLTNQNFENILDE